MECNVGKTDRTIRAIVGLLLVLVGGYGIYSNAISSTVSYISLIVGVVLLITVFTKFCILYKPFNINTCKD